jgi:hypothetical protein
LKFSFPLFYVNDVRFDDEERAMALARRLANELDEHVRVFIKRGLQHTRRPYVIVEPQADGVAA